jgi:ribonucleoside-diphosphate reductase beta chain
MTDLIDTYGDIHNHDADALNDRVYKLYEQAIDNLWNPRQIDCSQDIEDWEELDERRKDILRKIMTNFFVGEQAVAEEISPLLYAADGLNRFDWIAHFSTFLMEEVKHSEFCAQWHQKVPGIINREEIIPHLGLEEQTVDPTGTYEPTWAMSVALPKVMEELMQVRMDASNRTELERAFVRSVTMYNILTEGIAAQPSYQIIIDTCKQWNAFPALQEGFRNIKADEGRHIQGGALIINELISRNPEYEEIVHEVLDEYRSNIVGFISYQHANDELDMSKYQELKVRSYKQRCKEMGIEPDQSLVDEILDPKLNFAIEAR